MEEENTSENYYEREYNEKYDTYDYVNDAKNTDPKYEPSTAAKVLLVLMAIFYRGYTGNSHRRNLYEQKSAGI